MSKVGIQCVKYSKRGEDGNFTGAKDISTLVTFNGTPNKTEAEDWGDNHRVESSKSVNKIALSIELNDMAGKEYADICGHEYEEATRKVTVKSTDNAPMIGIGAIGNSERNGKEVFVMKLYPNTQFGDPNDDNSTETETKDYKHVTLDGTAYPGENKEIKIEQEFDTLEEAKAELDKLLSAPSV